MDIVAASIRRKLYGNTPSNLNYRKLSRNFKLPYDEENLNRKPKSNFFDFITDLLRSSNYSGGYLNVIIQ